jgi:hypothetical protein
MTNMVTIITFAGAAAAFVMALAALVWPAKRATTAAPTAHPDDLRSYAPIRSKD